MFTTLDSKPIRFLPVPEKPEESFRRLRPDIFFLPKNDVLNFLGKPVLENTSPFQIWKVIHRDFQNVNSIFKENLEKFANFNFDFDLLEQKKDRLVVLEIQHGIVDVYSSPQLQSFIEFKSQPSAFQPLSEKSEICEAFANRLQISIPHTLKIHVNSHNTEDPFFIVFDHTQPHFSQSYTSLHFQFEKNTLANLFYFFQGAEFSLNRMHLELKKNARVKSFFVASNPNENTNQNPPIQLVERLVTLDENSNLQETLFFSQKGSFRISQKVILEGVHSKYTGTQLTVGERCHFDFEPLYFHKSKESSSSLISKMILGKKGRGNFQGLIIVSENAPGCQASQQNKNILLHASARADAQPRLEVYPHDVICHHGSATGELDEKQIYYLTSRGFDEKNARRLLIESFAKETLKIWENEEFFLYLGEKWIEQFCEKLFF